MNKNKYRIVIGLVIVVCAVLAIRGGCFIFDLLNIGKEMTAYSYVSSVSSSLNKAKAQEVNEIAFDLKNEWRELTESEYKKVAQAMSRYWSIDRGGLSHEPNEILFDHWGHRIVIAGHKLSGGKPEFIVWSKGQDGILGTEDDLASPQTVLSLVETVK